MTADRYSELKAAQGTLAHALVAAVLDGHVQKAKGLAQRHRTLSLELADLRAQKASRRDIASNARVRDAAALKQFRPRSQNLNADQRVRDSSPSERTPNHNEQEQR